jgi:RHS repeat-associated protein
MGYDLSDQPTSVSQFGSGSSWFNKTYTGTYAYDGHKRRVKQVVDGVTIVSVYGQGGTLLHRHNKSTGERTDSVRVGEREVAWVRNGVPEYPLVDYLGTVRALTGGSGNILWKDEYLPYGDNLPAATAGRDAPSFAGHIQDSAAGLHYMQARFYEPASGRFLSIDQVGFSPARPDMFNRYTYALNDPVNMIDPDGNLPIPLMVAACAANAGCRGIVGGAVGAVVGAASSAIGQSFDGKEGMSLTRVGVDSAKGAAVGSISAATGRVDAAVATASIIGAADGGVSAAVDGDPQTTVAGGVAKGAITDGTATLVGGVVGAKAPVTSFPTGETLGTITGATAVPATNRALGDPAGDAIDAAAEKLRDIPEELE